MRAGPWRRVRGWDALRSPGGGPGVEGEYRGGPRALSSAQRRPRARRVTDPSTPRGGGGSTSPVAPASAKALAPTRPPTGTLNPANFPCKYNRQGGSGPLWHSGAVHPAHKYRVRRNPAPLRPRLWPGDGGHLSRTGRPDVPGASPGP